MPHYLLSVVYPPDATPPTERELEGIIAAVDAFHQELKDEGAWGFGGGLHEPSTATTVRVQDGEALVTDGPFIESKEILGGLSIISVPDLDVALAWAEKASRATTTPIEVRPFIAGSEA
jgi:hypothetical protein